MTISTVSVASPNTANLAVPSVTFGRTAFSGQERIAVTAGLSNKGDQPLKDVPVTLTIDGHEIQTERATVAPHASSSVTFTQFTLAGPNVRGNVRAGSDPMPADNSFHFVLAPSDPVSVAIVDGGERADAQPVPVEGAGDRHDAVVSRSTSRPPRASVRPPSTSARRHPERHDVSAGRRRRRAEEVRRARRRPAGRRRRSHVVAAGRSGAAAGNARRAGRSHGRPQRLAGIPRLQPSRSSRCSRRRAAATSPPRTSSAIARCSRRRPTASSRASTMARWRRRRRKVGQGRVIVWTTTLDDSWTDIGVKPIFLPLVHQLVRYLSHYEPATSWFTVGQVLDLAARAKDHADRIVVTPSGERISQPGAGEGERRAARAERTGHLRGPQAGRADECAARVAGRQPGPGGVGALGDGSGGAGRGGDRSRDRRRPSRGPRRRK